MFNTAACYTNNINKKERYRNIALKSAHSLELEEDYVIEYECEECEDCGSENILNTTSHEAQECANCGHVFDMWEDAYIDNANLNLYCPKCVNELLG